MYLNHYPIKCLDDNVKRINDSHPAQIILKNCDLHGSDVKFDSQDLPNFQFHDKFFDILRQGKVCGSK